MRSDRLLTFARCPPRTRLSRLRRSSVAHRHSFRTAAGLVASPLASALTTLTHSLAMSVVAKNIDRNHSGAGTGTEIQLLSNADNTCATLVVMGEDHTLGNAFRYVLAKNKEVDFVGYSIPHPSEMKMNMRVQTKTVGVSDVLVESAQTLSNICDHVVDTFDAAVKRYEQQQGAGKMQD